MDEIFCPCTHEELKAFLMAVYPPQLRITGFYIYFLTVYVFNLISNRFS